MWHFRDIFKKSKDWIPFGQLSLFLLSFRSDFNALAKMFWFLPSCFVISIWSNHFWWFFFHGHFLRKTSMMLLLNCFSFSVNGLAASCTLVWRSVNVTKLLNDVSQMKSFFGCHHSYFFVSQDTIPVEFWKRLLRYTKLYYIEIDSSGIQLPSAVCKVNLKSSKLRTHTSYGYCDDELLSAQEQQLLPKAFSSKPMFVRYFYGCEKTRFLPIHFLIVLLAEDGF